jgi:hypothetical protein
VSKDDALAELERRQQQLEAAGGRMTQFVEMFRDERDDAIRRAKDAGATTREIAPYVKASPQWVNKVLRGEAYRRRSDFLREG